MYFAHEIRIHRMLILTGSVTSVHVGLFKMLPVTGWSDREFASCWCGRTEMDDEW